MWELGEETGALLIFAEHRYFGESKPNLVGVRNCLGYCSSQQALADYAVLVPELREKLGVKESSSTIAFGGSYGGMLTAWMRIKYPNIIDGGIAASAPIWGFPSLEPRPALDGSAVAITRAFSAAGGATDGCSRNLKAACE